MNENDDSSTKANDKDQPSAPASAAFALATEYLAGILVFTLAGRWLDARLNTDVFFTLCGLFVGFAFGLYFTWRLVRSINDAEASSSHSSSPPPAHPGPKPERPQKQPPMDA